MSAPVIARPVIPFEFIGFDSWESFSKGREDLTAKFNERIERENAISGDSSKPVKYQGHCGICRRDVEFSCDWVIHYNRPDGTKGPVWRERLVCPCGLSNRLRASLHFLLDQCDLKAEDSIYLTEQTTPFFKLVGDHFENLVGSEFLSDGTAKGKANARGFRHEDITDLTFDDESFNVLGTFEVLEHVPDYHKAIAEMYRVLKPGGHLVATFPFRIDLPETLVRAKIGEDGEIEHLMDPEYHGDPLSKDGVLCFYHFGWDILDAMRAAGFKKARCAFFWSWESGYLGAASSLFHAVK